MALDSQRTTAAEPAYWCIIPAAGVGSRMGAAIPKQYLTVCGATILDHTLEKITYLDWIQGIVVAIADADTRWPEMAWANHPKVHVCSGGAERVNSVYNALLLLADFVEPDDWILVHDVARPCVSPVDIEHLRDQVKTSTSGGLLGACLNDTLKRVGDHGVVESTVDRKNMWRALTPQMFRYRILRCAIETALQQGILVTDEASAVECAGHEVKMVRGSERNIKITTPEDLDLASYYLTREVAHANASPTNVSRGTQ